MPSDTKRGGRRTQIYNWRVKSGNKEIFSDPQKLKCREFIRDHQKEYREKLKLVPPNV